MRLRPPVLLLAVLGLFAAPAGALAGTVRTDRTPEQIRAYHDSGDYQAAMARTWASATKYVKAQLRAGKVRKPAVVLDIDETAMSNYACLDDADFDPGVGLAVCVGGGKSVAIAPALAFYKQMLRRKVAVFFITGAPDSLCGGRRTNLTTQGFTGTLRLTCRPTDYQLDSLVPYKSGARRALAKQGWTILANVGDQRSDLAGGSARRTFKLVNPMYVTA